MHCSAPYDKAASQLGTVEVGTLQVLHWAQYIFFPPINPSWVTEIKFFKNELSTYGNTAAENLLLFLITSRGLGMHFILQTR